MLSFYLAFLYSDRAYYDDDRILCMAQFLFKLQQKGLLKRFSINCYGTQETLEDNRSKKAEMFKKLKNKRGTKEYDEWFLKYNPTNKTQKADKIEKKTSKAKVTKRREKKNKKHRNKTKKVRFNFGAIEL